MANGNLKGFLDFLKQFETLLKVVSGFLVLILSPLLNWIVAFGPPAPSKGFVSFLTIVCNLVVVGVCYVLLRDKKAGTYLVTGICGIVVLLFMIVLYTSYSIDNVIDLPPRVVKGTEYTQEAKFYREGYRDENGTYPTDTQMVRELVEQEGGSGDTPGAIVERLWTRASVSRSEKLLLVYWVTMFLALTLGVSVFLLYLQTRPSGPPAPPASP
jgi:hypothetical protein